MDQNHGCLILFRNEIWNESLSSLAKTQTHIHILIVEKEESESRGGQTRRSAD